METILTILLLYIIAVAIYTVIVRNDAMHKYSPHTKIFDIIKEGLVRMGIGFLICGLILSIIYGICHFIS